MTIRQVVGLIFCFLLIIPISVWEAMRGAQGFGLRVDENWRTWKYAYKNRE